MDTPPASNSVKSPEFARLARAIGIISAAVALALYGVLHASDGVALTQAVEFRSDCPALLTLKRRPGDVLEDEVLVAPSIVLLGFVGLTSPAD